jgi:hypothetical protein
MKNFRKLTALLCLAALTLAMTACGSKESLPESAAEIIDVAMSKMEKEKDMEVDMKMEMDMAMLGESMSMVMSGKSLIFSDPLKAKVEMNIDMGAQGSEQTTVYLGKEDDKYYTYTEMQGTWMKQAIGDSELDSALSGYGGSQDVEIYKRNKDAFSIIDTVNEDGKEYTVLEGNLPKDSFEEVFNSMGMGEQLGQLGIDDSALAGLELEEDLKIIVWVDNKTVTVKKMSMDMTSLMNTLMNSIMGASMAAMEEAETSMDFGIEIGKCTMEMDYIKFGKIENFEIPKEALEAEEFSLEGLVPEEAPEAE